MDGSNSILPPDSGECQTQMSIEQSGSGTQSGATLQTVKSSHLADRTDSGSESQSVNASLMPLEASPRNAEGLGVHPYTPDPKNALLANPDGIGSSPLSMKELALAYAEAGFRVFPAIEYGTQEEVDRGIVPKKIVKRPYIEAWGQEASSDPAKVRHWWNQWPNAIPALLTGGPNGFSVVDCDAREKGLTYFRDACRRYGGLPDLPETLRVQTPHGLHFYFTVSEAQTDLRPSVGWSFEERKVQKKTDVDTRTDGAYIIAPGSRLRDGSVYRLPCAPLELRSRMAPLPEWLHEILKPLPKVQEPVPVSAPMPFSGEMTAPDKVAYQTILGKLSTAPEGTRNSTASTTAFTLGGWISAGRLPEAGVLENLIAACRQNGLMKDDQAGTLKTLRSGLEKGKEKPLYATPVYSPNAHCSSPVRTPEATMQTITPDTSNPPEFDDFTPEDMASEAPQKMNDSAANQPGNEPCEVVDNNRYTPPEFHSIADCYEDLLTELQTVIPPIKTGLSGLDYTLDGGLRPGLTMLGATPGCGKSALMLQVADHIAAHGRPVLYYALEMSAREMLERSLLRYSFKKPILSDPDPKVNETKLRLYCEDFSKKLRNILAGKKPESEEAELTMARAKSLYRHEGAPRVLIRTSKEVKEKKPGMMTAEGIRDDVAAFIDSHPDLPLPVVIVDYLQLVHTRDEKADRSEYDRMGEVSLCLKKLSEGGFPVISISSFARSSYYCRPSLEGFKGSGGIEYTANACLILGYREFVEPEATGNKGKAEAYNRSIVDDYSGKGAIVPARLEVRCVKARGFLLGRTELAFYGGFYKFEDVPALDRIKKEQIYDRFKLWSKAMADTLKQ